MSNQALGPAFGSAPTDDSDLEDLIAKEGDNKASKVETFNLDTLTNDHPVSSYSAVSPFYLLSYTCALCLSSRLSKCILIFLAIGLISTLYNPTVKTGIMGADYSAIQSAYDLSLSQVHHWCILGDNDSCMCEDPLEPQNRQEFKSWNAAYKANVAEVGLYRALTGESPTTVDIDTGKTRPPLDVAFLGESVVEAMDGRWLGKHIIGTERRTKDFNRIDKTFEQLFRKDKGAPVEGVALGIAGDTTSNVLWRIQHNEMPYDFNPKVWWLVLGMNDLTRMQCSEEIVILGILRVIEEIRFRKPDAKIVINSMLPMVSYQDGEMPTMADAVDFTNIDSKNEAKSREVSSSFRVGGKGNDDDDKKHHTVRALKEKKSQQRPQRESPPKIKKISKKERERMEENATKGPDLDKAMERKKKKMRKMDKKVEKKVMNDNEKYHPKRPVSPLVPFIKKKQLPPVWPAIHLINDKLREFASKHDSITFFDATDIFAFNDGGGKHHLNVELISPRGHPSPKGFAAWENSLMTQLKKILDEIPKPQPIEADDYDYGEFYNDDDEFERDNNDEYQYDGGEGSDHVSEGKLASAPVEHDEAPVLPGRNKQAPESDDNAD